MIRKGKIGRSIYSQTSLGKSQSARVPALRNELLLRSLSFPWINTTLMKAYRPQKASKGSPSRLRRDIVYSPIVNRLTALLNRRTIQHHNHDPKHKTAVSTQSQDFVQELETQDTGYTEHVNVDRIPG
jgi:hypothetical protein